MQKRATIRRMIFMVSACLVLNIGCGHAMEEADAPVTIFLELLGNGGIYSVNADYRLAPACSVRLGYVAWHAAGFFDEHEELTAAPLLVNFLAGQGNHWLEAGVGVLYGHFKSKNSRGELIENYTFTTLTGSLAYRYQRPHGGAFFKAGLTPFYSFAKDDKAYPEDGLLPWFGLAGGYSF